MSQLMPHAGLGTEHMDPAARKAAPPQPWLCLCLGAALEPLTGPQRATQDRFLEGVCVAVRVYLILTRCTDRICLHHDLKHSCEDVFIKYKNTVPARLYSS